MVNLWGRAIGAVSLENDTAAATGTESSLWRQNHEYTTNRAPYMSPIGFMRHLILQMPIRISEKELDAIGAAARVRQSAAEQVPPVDQTRFVEVVETEIMSLHEGNIARYQLRPAEYRAWRESWR